MIYVYKVISIGIFNEGVIRIYVSLAGLVTIRSLAQLRFKVT